MRELVLGTAGHIDHGKTSLVRALTGIDCDRLPEERARGMTIDIGFAHLALGAFALSVVDVPGHERFIRNMLAGATGIDLCMLVVAADDAVMPQTREHLAILSLLGLRQGVIALTKVDLVDDSLRELAEADIRDAVAHTFLAQAPILPVSAKTGAGLDALKAALVEACQRVEPREDCGLFRLAVDRMFVSQGHGTVLTGTVASGVCRVGDELACLPRGTVVRVRSLHSHGQAVDEVSRGMRAGLNVVGLKHDEVERGDELASRGYLAPSRVVTIEFTMLSEAPRPLKHHTPVRVHFGAAELMASVSLLDAARIEPGGHALAQLNFDTPTTCIWGQPLVVREASANWTLGGGRVIQPHARPIRRRRPEILERLTALAVSLVNGDELDRTTHAVWFAGLAGLSPKDLPRTVGVPVARLDDLIARLVADERIESLALPRIGALLVHSERLSDATNRILAAVDRAHAEAPWMKHFDRGQLESQLGPSISVEINRVLVERLLAAGTLLGDSRRVRRAEHEARLTAAQARLRDSLLAAYADAAQKRRLHVADLERDAGSLASFVAPFLQSLAEEGQLVHIEQDIYLHAACVARLKRIVNEQFQVDTGYRVADIRLMLDSVRQVVVPFCEYLDRLRITRREGDVRFLVSPALASGTSANTASATKTA